MCFCCTTSKLPLPHGSQSLFGLEVLSTPAVNFQLQADPTATGIQFYQGFLEANASKPLLQCTDVRSSCRVFNLRNPLDEARFAETITRLRARGYTVNVISLHVF